MYQDYLDEVLEVNEKIEKKLTKVIHDLSSELDELDEPRKVKNEQGEDIELDYPELTGHAFVTFSDKDGADNTIALYDQPAWKEIISRLSCGRFFTPPRFKLPNGKSYPMSVNPAPEPDDILG